MMKNKIILGFLSLGFLLSPQLSQAQNKIIVVKDDGSIEEVTLDQDAPAPEVKKQEQKVKVQPKQEASKIATTPQPSPAKSKAKSQPEEKIVYLPYPPHKPSSEEIARVLAAIKAKPVFAHVDPKNIPEGTRITRDLAVRVALEVAPPSRGFQVYPTTYNDKPAYQVRFKTEHGPHDVVVDSDTGKVLKK